MKKYIVVALMSLGMGYAPTYALAQEKTKHEEKEIKKEDRRKHKLNETQGKMDKKEAKADRKERKMDKKIRKQKAGQRSLDEQKDRK